MKPKSYAAYCCALSLAAAKYKLRLAFTSATFQAFMQGVTPEAYVKSLPRPEWPSVPPPTK